MNFEEFEKHLVNGLHDSRLKSFSIDYVTRIIRLNLDIFIGEPDVNSKKDREMHRSAEVKFLNFDFCIIDPPQDSYPFKNSATLTIDAGAGQPLKSELPLPSYSGFLFWIYVNEWNSFIRIAAQDIQIQWDLA